jgi:CheY-like chemotaxis protein
VSVTDTGVGIPRELHQRIFEPFFTTKEVGKGTGLGLAVAFGVMQDHSGTIVVESAQDAGSTFTILLPLYSDDGSQTYTKGDYKSVLPARILIVDDEKSNRELIGRYLADQGHKILYASDGSEAIRLVDDQANALDLVLLDIVLPRVSGEDVYRKIREIRPDMAVVIATGSAQYEKIDQMLSHKMTGLVAKPFRRDNLIQEIARLQALSCSTSDP